MIICCLFAVVYYLAGEVALLLAFEQSNISPVWPPSGIAIAALLYFGLRMWPGVFAGAFALNFFLSTPFMASLGIASGNTLEAVLATYLLTKVAGRYPFRKVIAVIWFVLIVVLATMVAATIGLLSLTLAGLVAVADFSLLWGTWWLGDLVGALLVTPLLLTWIRMPDFVWKPGRVAEALVLLLATMLLTQLVFGGSSSLGQLNYSISFLLLPPMIWAALRFQRHGATLMAALLSVLAIAGTLSGYGPFVVDNANQSLLMLQAFIGVIVVTALILAASIDEREKADALLRAARVDLEKQVIKRTEALSEANRSLEIEIERTAHSTSALEGLLRATALSSGEEFYRSCVMDLAKTYNSRYAFIGVFSDENKNRIETLAVSIGQGVGDNFSYDLKGTPCEQVLDLGMQIIPRGASIIYDQDEMLVTMGVESYFGAPLVSSDNTMIGLVAVMDSKPMELQDWIKPVLGVYANRIAFELERIRANEELELAASVFRESIEGVVICDADNRILRVNPAFSRITGYSFEEVCGQTPGILQSGHHAPEFYKDFWHSLLNDGVWQGELWDRRKNGETFPIWQAITVVRDNQGEIKQFISIFNDITEKKMSEERIYYLAHYDILTGLPNRAAFQDLLNRAITHAQRESGELALLFMDLDHFKLINDTLGHPLGDELLKQVSSRLKNIVREEDTVSRMSGDEFTVLLPAIDSQEDAVVVAEKILKGFSEPFRLDDTEVVVSTSIGISTYPNDGLDAAALLKNADVAMYSAKVQGRNNFQFFTMEMNKKALHRLSLQADLRKAIENREFVLYYQPQVDIRSGEIVGCEALIRWLHPNKGLISPVNFIPVAEECGLISAIGEWVLDQACRQSAQWDARGYCNLRMAVNLSARQFMKQDLLHIVSNTIEQTGVLAGNLELELTESMVMRYVDESIDTLKSLRTMGLHVSIDDFGTGYSSMSYLKKFALSKLKIDRSFIADIAAETDSTSIVATIIALGQGLNLKVIAEGVETQQQLRFLMDNGCEEMQGYYFSHPLPADEFEKLLQTGRKLDLAC